MQLAGVQYVLDTVNAALALNKDRTFIYGEIVSRSRARWLHPGLAAEVLTTVTPLLQAFLVRWWSEQTAAVKEMFKDAVSRDAMEIVNGG